MGEVRTTRPLHGQPQLMAVVALGGATGSMARYLVTRAVPTAADGWPVATLTVNLAGSLVLGLLLEALARRGADRGRRQVLRLLVGTGFCGGLTTYSTLALEIDLLLRHDRAGLALTYGLVSVVAGLVATAVGVGLAVVVRR